MMEWGYHPVAFQMILVVREYSHGFMDFLKIKSSSAFAANKHFDANFIA